jgi:hypothetical protein
MRTNGIVPYDKENEYKMLIFRILTTNYWIEVAVHPESEDLRKSHHLHK